MPYLTLLYGNKVLGQYSVDHGYPITIGRKDSNNIVINNLAVSGTHACIEFKNEGVFVIDLQSKNGTFLNGKTTLKSLLKEGDEIVIGKHKLLFSEKEEEKKSQIQAIPTISASNQSLDETMVLDTNKYRDMISNILSSATGQPLKKKPPTPVLLVQAGGKGKIALKNKFTRIGKEKSNDIVGGGFFAGKRAATVTKRNDGYYVNHVKGIAKTKVNGTKVKSSQILHHGDIVSVGKLKMRFLSKAKAAASGGSADTQTPGV